MTDTYYSHEDTPPDTADSAVELWRQQTEPLAGYLAEAEKISGEVETALGARYEQAEKVGDEKTKAELIVTYNHVQSMVQMIRHYDAGKIGSEVAIVRLVEQVGQATQELHEIMQAIENQDESNPAVGDLIDIVREDERENLDWYVEEAVETNYTEMAETAYDEAHEALKQVTTGYLMDHFGVSGLAAERFAALLVEHCALLTIARALKGRDGRPVPEVYQKWLDWHEKNRAAFQEIGAAIEGALGEGSVYAPPQEED